MKILSTALLAAGLVALGGCGGGNDAANNVAATDYNVAPDDFGNDTGLGNDVTLGNDTLVDNTTANLGTENAAANAAANTQ